MHGIQAPRAVFRVILAPLLLGALCGPVGAAGEPASTRIRNPTDPLGISGMECRCKYTSIPSRRLRAWYFQSEPRITGISPGGPADGKLRPGDAIVGIDGMPITTRQAGVRFANLQNGKTVQLTVRRSGRMVAATIVPRGVSAADSLAALGVGRADAESLEAYSRSLEQLARLSAGSDEVHYPLGWFGFKLHFSGSIVHEHGAPQWHFDSAPRVGSVRPGSPAHRAGIRRGDVLTHCDGVRLDSDEGGRRFSAVEPGQTVRWTLRRGRVERTVEATAVQRPAP